MSSRYGLKRLLYFVIDSRDSNRELSQRRRSVVLVLAPRGSSRLRSLSLSGCARRRATRRDVALAACVESAYARPRYAICANVLIATLPGEHKRQKQSLSFPSHSVDEELRSRRPRAAVRAHACVPDTRGCTHRPGYVSPAAPRLRDGFRRLLAPHRENCNETRRVTSRYHAVIDTNRSSEPGSLSLILVNFAETSRNSVSLCSTSCVSEQ